MGNAEDRPLLIFVPVEGYEAVQKAIRDLEERAAKDFNKAAYPHGREAYARELYQRFGLFGWY